MSYTQLSAEERERISCNLAQGCSLRAIACGLQRSPSTIFRELARHGQQAGYSAVRAQQRAQALLHNPRRAAKLAERPYYRLRQQVLYKLRQHYAPQQIAGWLRRTYPDEPERWVSHQTIYTFVDSCRAASSSAMSCAACAMKARLETGHPRPGAAGCMR